MNRNLYMMSMFLTVILALVIVLTYRYVMGQSSFQEQKIFETEVEKMINAESLNSDSNQMDEVKSGNNRYNKYYIYYSSKENKNIIKQLETQTKSISNEMRDSRSMVLSFIDEELNGKFTNRKIVTKKYRWNNQTKVLDYLGETKEVSEIILSKNRKVPYLKDIINDEADLIAINRVVQEQILNTHFGESNVIDNNVLKQVLKNNFIGENNKINIYTDYLEIFFDSERLGLKKINVNFEKILPFIDPSIVLDHNISKRNINQEKKYAALTFDDGPNTTSTIRLLNELKENNIKATFFVLGKMVDKNPEVAKKIVEEGHEIGNHSYNHPDLTKLTIEEVKKEVLKTDKAVFNATGILPNVFRPPYGAVNGEVARAVGLPIIQWNVDSEDWKIKNKNLIVSQVVNTVQNGSIILIHDIHDVSVESVPEIVRQLKERGYEFVTISELLSNNQKPLNQYFSMEDEREIK